MTKTVQLAKWGNGVAVRLCPDILNQTGLNKDSVVTVRVNTANNEITIKPFRKHTSLAERFADYNGDYRGETIDWGTDVGGEICD